MAKLDLREIIEQLSEYDTIVLVPDTDEPLYGDIFDKDVFALLAKYGLRENWRGLGRHFDHIAAAADSAKRFTNKYITYSVRFDSELAANRFLNRVNDDPETSYRAEVPGKSVGLAAHKIEDEITKK